MFEAMAGWTFLTNHGTVLVCIAHDPSVRLREIAARVGVTERTAHAIVTDLAAAGYVIKQREGRRNRYQIRADLPLRQPLGRQPTIGEVLDILVDTTTVRATHSSDGQVDRTQADPEAER